MIEDILPHFLTTLSVQVHAVAFCEIESGWRLEESVPADTLRIHYVLKGEGTVVVGDHPPVRFGPNAMIIPPRVVPHTVGFSDAAHVAVAADVETITQQGFVRLTAGNGRQDILTACGAITADYAGALGLFDRLDNALVEDLSPVAHLRHAFAYMIEELAQPGLGTREVVGALMKQCLISLLRIHLKERGTRSPILDAFRDPRLVHAITAILDAPAAPHSVESLASLCGMSRSSFAERFATTFGEGPVEFLHRARLRLAAQLLTTTGLPVKGIASSVGYASRSYFSHAFKAAYGADPTAYRRQRADTAKSVESLGGARFDDKEPPEEAG